MSDTQIAERAQLQTRTLTFEVDRAAPPEANADIPVVISSDAAVEVRDGLEILVHSAASVDLSRAPLPIIATHSQGQLNVGVVDGITVGGGVMRGMARFGSRPEAVGYRSDVSTGIIRSVSVGYARLHATVRRDGVLVTDRWMPMHVAMVGEPADVNAGFYRSSTETAFVLDVEREADPTEQEVVSAAAVRDVATPPAKPATTVERIAMSDAATAAAGTNADTSNVANNGTHVERLRIQTLHGLCRQHKIDDKQRDEWIDKGVTADVASSEILNILAERNRSSGTPAAQVGLSAKETRNYSLHRGVQAILGHGNWDKAGLEFEAHKTIRDKLNRDCGKNSFYVPVEVQERAVATHEKRDLTVATSSAGGYLVETSNQGFIDILRNRSVVMNMGARRLTGLVGNLTVPKQSGAATAYWLSTEATQITEGALTFGQLSLSPKSVGAYVEISRQLLLQASPSAEQITMVDLAAQLGLAVDTASLNGSGSSGQPLGLLGTSGIGTSASGTTLGYSGCITMQTDVAGANALTASAGYVTTPTVAGLLMGRSRFANTDTPVWDGSILDGTVAGFHGMSSNQMSSATMVFGDWQQLVIAEWGVLEVEVNPVANFQAGIVGVRAIYSVDIGLRYAAAFSKVASIT